MPKCWILVSSDHNTFTQFSSESFRCPLANFRRACTWIFLSRGALQVLQDFSPSRHSVLPIVFLVTMIPAALRSLRSSRVVLDWFLSPEDLAWSHRPREIDSYLFFFHLRIIAQLLWPSYQAAWRWSCSPFQPCVGLQSCPWHPWTALWSWPRWRVWNLIGLLLLWTGCLFYR